MANHRPFEKIQLSTAHLPTLLLFIGYPVYWLELYCPGNLRCPVFTWSWLLFIATALLASGGKSKEFLKYLRGIKNRLESLDLFTKSLLGVSTAFILLTLSAIFYAYLLPPHLVQESDALTYHITIPKQHLMLHSFQHIRWSTADLYYLPVDFALAPFWLATTLPNKFPQFIFLLGLIGVAVNLVNYFSRKNFMSLCLIVMAIFASHNVGIQMGTAMLDIVMCYLLLAALDSFLKGSIFIGAIEFTFYFWSKSFLPLQTVLILAFVMILWFMSRTLGVQEVTWGFAEGPETAISGDLRARFKKLFIFFAFLSLGVGGPFALKSLYYAGTPFFPLAPGIAPIRQMDYDSLAWRSLTEKAQQSVLTRDQYGSGRSPVEFLKHLWLLAVPEKDVNNRYDYPVGLMYLLFVGPFFYMLWQTLRERKFPLLPMFICVFWLIWWMGSQQSRFLFVPIMLMLIMVTSAIRTPSRVLMGVMTVGLVLVSLSVYRAHKQDLGRSGYDVLREKDRVLIKMATTVNRFPVILDFPDAAFANFPVEVKTKDSVFVIDNASGGP